MVPNNNYFIYLLQNEGRPWNVSLITVNIVYILL